MVSRRLFMNSSIWIAASTDNLSVAACVEAEAETSVDRTEICWSGVIACRCADYGNLSGR